MPVDQSESPEGVGEFREMLIEIGQEDLLVRLEEILKGMEESDKRINDTLEKMLGEVDRLLLQVEGMSEGLGDEDEANGN